MERGPVKQGKRYMKKGKGKQGGRYRVIYNNIIIINTGTMTCKKLKWFPKHFIH